MSGKAMFVSKQQNPDACYKYYAQYACVDAHGTAPPEIHTTLPPVDRTDTWTLGLSNGVNGTVDVGEAQFNALFWQSPHHIIKRLCPSCNDDYKEMYYRRYTLTGSFAVYDYMKQNWMSTNNIINQDFGLFSTYADALNRANAWQYCNYDDRGVGFPRDCGIVGGVGWQWNSWSSRWAGRSKRVSFLIEGSPPTGVSIVSLHKPASQSSTGWAGSSERAVCLC